MIVTKSSHLRCLTYIIGTCGFITERDPRNPNLIVCGDFNGNNECGAVRYLEDGGIGPSFIEDGAPVASREKPCPMTNPLIDVSSSISSIRPEPPTLVVKELISQMVKQDTSAYEKPDLSQDVVERLSRIYRRYASHASDDVEGIDDKVMNIDDVERWLIDINKQVGRGSEFRTAAREMGWTEPEVDENEEGDTKEKPRIFLPPDGILSLQGFLNVYHGELLGGKFWGINYDLSIMGEALPQIGTFAARYDRMLCSTKLVPTAVLDTTSTTSCPNDVEPSDHLPVAASFKIAELN